MTTSEAGVRCGGCGASRANLIVHHGGTDIFDQAIKSIHTRGALKQFRDPPPIFQRGEVPENPVEFPRNRERQANTRPVTFGDIGLPIEDPSPSFLLDLTVSGRHGQQPRKQFDPRNQRPDRLVAPRRLLRRS